MSEADVQLKNVRDAIAAEFEYHSSLFEILAVAPWFKTGVAVVFCVPLKIAGTIRRPAGCALVDAYAYQAEIVAADTSLWNRYQDVQIRRAREGRKHDVGRSES